MKKRKIGFKGEVYEETSLEDFENDWILLTLGDNTSWAGKLVELGKEQVGLLPYQKLNYGEDGLPELVVEDKGLPYVIKRIDIRRYREASREQVENFVKNVNRDNYLGELKKQKEQIELEHFLGEYAKSQKRITIEK